MAKPYKFGTGIETPGGPVPYRRRPKDPVHRPLRIYTLDPGVSQFDGSVATLQVPWEPAGPGPSGHVFVVRDIHEPSGRRFQPIELESPEVLLGHGLKPSTQDPRFAQQMTYAVAMATYERFRLALGRLPEFAPDIRRRGPLEIRPHYKEEDNAYYDPDAGALLFGYVRSSRAARGRTQPGAFVYTSLSHDVIVHEVTHALLDGMRPHLMLPTNPDVAAFHEGFSDLVALLMRFRYAEVVKAALKGSNGGLDSRLLTELAREWGRSSGDGQSALRQVILRRGDPDSDLLPGDRYDPKKPHHDLGAVLVGAVFEAMSRIFDRKTSTLRRIGAQAPHAHDHLVDLLAREARDLAGQFLHILIRAIDYCPPVDLTFGEYLRALVTADFVTVPEDPYGYREALVLAFRRFGITVPDVADISEESLLWRPPSGALDPLRELAFQNLEHGAEPGSFAEVKEVKRRATVLGDFITKGHHAEFGLTPPGTDGEDRFEPPVIESCRPLRRLSPDEELNFHVVAEITQRTRRKGRWFYGGSTVILDEGGEFRYVIRKSVRSRERRQRTDDFLAAAPAEFRDLFTRAEFHPGAMIRRLHAR